MWWSPSTRTGNVTGARVASTRAKRAVAGDGSPSRRPPIPVPPRQEGEKTVQSQMVLTFLFKPDSDEF